MFSLDSYKFHEMFKFDLTFCYVVDFKSSELFHSMFVAFLENLNFVLKTFHYFCFSHGEGHMLIMVDHNCFLWMLVCLSLLLSNHNYNVGSAASTIIHQPQYVENDFKWIGMEITCSWHQKTKSPIHEFKVLQKGQRAF